MKHISIIFAVLVVSLFAQTVDTTYIGLFRKYWDYGPKMTVQLQMPDSSFQKTYIVDDEDPGNMAMGNLFEFIEDVLAMEDTLKNREYVNADISSKVEISVDSNDYIVSAFVWPFENRYHMRSSFYHPYASTDDTVAAWISPQKNTGFYAALADSGALRVVTYFYRRQGYRIEYDPAIKMENCFNKESHGFKGLAYTYIADAVDAPRNKYIFYIIWNRQSGPFSAGGKLDWREEYSDINLLYADYPWMENFTHIKYLFKTE